MGVRRAQLPPNDTSCVRRKSEAYTPNEHNMRKENALFVQIMQACVQFETALAKLSEILVSWGAVLLASTKG